MGILHAAGRPTRLIFTLVALWAAGTLFNTAGAQSGRLAAAVSGDAWTVETVSGSVKVRQPGSGETALAVGDQVAVGTSIAAANGRATLVRGKGRITVSPHSAMAVGDNGSDSLYTRIIQSVGTLLFEVEKNPAQRFEVETPFLAATVKGTVFTVALQDAGASVHVTEGAVQVASRDGRSSVLVRPGQSATMPSKPGSAIELRKRESSSEGSGSSAGTAAVAASAGGSGSNGAAGQTLNQTIGQTTPDFAAQTKGFAGNAGHGPAAAASATAQAAYQEAGGNSGLNGGNGNSGAGHSVASAALSSNGAAGSTALSNVLSVGAPIAVSAGNGNGNGAGNSNAGGNGNNGAVSLVTGSGSNGNAYGVGNNNTGGSGNANGNGAGNNNAGGNGNGNAGGNGNNNAGGNGNGNGNGLQP